MKNKPTNYFGLPPSEKKKIIRRAGKAAQKMMNETIRKADHIVDTNEKTDSNLFKRIWDYLFNTCPSCKGTAWYPQFRGRKCKDCGREEGE